VSACVCVSGGVKRAACAPAHEGCQCLPACRPAPCPLPTACLRLPSTCLCTALQAVLLPPTQPASRSPPAVQVVNTCHAAGISRKVVRLRPIAVVKG